MKLTMRIWLTVTAVCCCFSVLAHEGHDHGHWTAGILHFLFYASLVAAAGAIVFAVAKKLSKPTNNV